MSGKYYLTTDLLQSCGDIPASFVFENGDSIIINGSLVNIHNPGCQIDQIQIGMDWHAGLTADPTGVDRLRCDEFPMGYQQVGWSETLVDWSNGINGCGGTQFGLRYDVCIGGGTFISQPFPFEIRKWIEPKTAGFEIPPGLTLDYVNLNRIDNSRHVGQSGSFTINTDVTAHTFISDGYVVMDWDSFYASCTGNDQSDSPNGGYRYYIRAYFEGSCSSEEYTPQMYVEGNLDYCSPALIDQTHRVEKTKGSPITVSYTHLTLPTIYSV